MVSYCKNHLANPNHGGRPESDNPATVTTATATMGIKDKTASSDGIMAKKKSKSRSEKAGLTMPVSKINRHLRDSRRAKRVGAGAPVYMAAVLEYAAAEILELAGKELGKRKRIMPADIMKVIRKDEELNKLMGGCSVFSGDRVKGVSDAVTVKKPMEP